MPSWSWKPGRGQRGAERPIPEAPDPRHRAPPPRARASHRSLRRRPRPGTERGRRGSPSHEPWAFSRQRPSWSTRAPGPRGTRPACLASQLMAHHGVRPDPARHGRHPHGTRRRGVPARRLYRAPRSGRECRPTDPDRPVHPDGGFGVALLPALGLQDYSEEHLVSLVAILATSVGSGLLASAVWDSGRARWRRRSSGRVAWWDWS